MCNIGRCVCDDVFVSKRPSSSAQQLDRFVVVALKNYRAAARTYKRAYAQFHLFAKCGSGGIERSDVLEEMLGRLLDAMRENRNDAFVETDAEPFIGESAADGADFFSLPVQWRIHLKNKR